MTTPHEDTPEYAVALDAIERDGKNVFITGHAGTGKSTFLNHLRKATRKNHVVLAPTGVAAVNVKGQTIHSFFHFRPDVTPDNVAQIRIYPKQQAIYQNLDMMIIDEISMVRADLLDTVNAFLKLYGPNPAKPMGGVQVVVVGDLYQLSPVVRRHEQELFQTVYSSPYFYDARVFPGLKMDLIEFETNYRQSDDTFIELLTHIRNNTVASHMLSLLNERYQPDFVPDDTAFAVYLTTTNQLADAINEERLLQISEELFTFEGQREGAFDERNLPTREELDLKVGAQVMLLNNDPSQRWVNGSIGKVIDIFGDSPETMGVQIELREGLRIEVEPVSWEIYRFFYNEEIDAIDSEVVGAFRQLPLKLAWAVTIHKSQGKTFDRVILDTGRGAFCPGQMYVALSRCRTLEGIRLIRPITARDIFTDPRVHNFLLAYQYQLACDRLPLSKRESFLQEAINNERVLELTYLKEDGQKTHRQIIPRRMTTIRKDDGDSEPGVEAFCVQRRANWIFRLNCIIEINILDPEKTALTLD